MMTLKIFHTGDIHLGMKFNNYADEVKEALTESRFLTLENMIKKSNDLNADLFVVAGDLFNTIQVSKKDIHRAVKILDKFNGACVLVLPGNHDYDNGKIELWTEFASVPSEKILLLNKKEHYSLDDYDLDVAIYPGPCENKHSSENSLDWIKEKGLCQSSKYHIGIAHGALEGISPDLEGNYYYMGLNELESIPTDLWLLGHTHIRYPFKDEILDNKIFNAGTPEPDGLNYRGEGSAWYITLDNGKNMAEKVVTGEYRFFDEKFHVNQDEDLNSIMSWAVKDDPTKKIIRLTLQGSVSNELYESLRDFYDDLQSKIFHLIVDDSKLRIRINKETIEKEFTRGSFPYEFLNGLIHDEESLQIAYDLLRRG